MRLSDTHRQGKNVPAIAEFGAQILTACHSRAYATFRKSVTLCRLGNVWRGGHELWFMPPTTHRPYYLSALYR